MSRRIYKFLSALLVGAGVAAAAACYSVPPLEERLEETVVTTKYVPETKFGEYSTFAINPSVRVVSADNESEDAPLDTGSSLVARVVTNMTSRGYTQVEPAASPDLGIQLVIVQKLNVAYYAVPYYYWGWYGYYGPWYWGYPGYGYYAPWAYSVSAWQSTTLVLEVFDLQKPRRSGELPRFEIDAGGLLDSGSGSGGSGTGGSDGGADAGRGPYLIDAVFAGFVYGIASSSATYDLQRALDGIDQAFAQTPTFKR